jgi:hypothetical protein
MATTTNYGWTTPDDTALVKDGASAIRTLGSSVDTTTKNLNPETTLGDIAYRSSSANVKTRLGIGSTGNVLTVTGGVPVWAAPAPSGDKPLLVPSISGEYLKIVTNSALGERYMDEDVTEYVPIYLPGYALDRISTRTGSGLLNGQTVRLGIYNASTTTGLPTTVYLDAGTVAPNAANTNYEITISTTPPAGYYYLAFNAQTTQPNPYFATMSSPIWSSFFAPSDTVQDVSYIKGFKETGVTGAFATAGTLSILTSNPPLIAVRMA